MSCCNEKVYKAKANGSASFTGQNGETIVGTAGATATSIISHKDALNIATELAKKIALQNATNTANIIDESIAIMSGESLINTLIVGPNGTVPAPDSNLTVAGISTMDILNVNYLNNVQDVNTNKLSVTGVSILADVISINTNINDLTVLNDSNLGNLNVFGNTNLKSELSVAGISTMDILNVNYLNNVQDVNTSKLSVTGVSILADVISINTNINDLTVLNDSNLGNLNVFGNTNLKSGLSVTGGISTDTLKTLSATSFGLESFINVSVLSGTEDLVVKNSIQIPTKTNSVGLTTDASGNSTIEFPDMYTNHNNPSVTDFTPSFTSFTLNFTEQQNCLITAMNNLYIPINGIWTLNISNNSNFNLSFNDKINNLNNAEGTPHFLHAYPQTITISPGKFAVVKINCLKFYKADVLSEYYVVTIDNVH